MQVSFVMTIIGRDRPGLVGELSAVIADHGGNWLESRMAHLGGQFAGILRVQLPAENETKLLTALHRLETQGLSVRAESDRSIAAPAACKAGTIEVVGHDRPGIIRQIAQVLTAQQVNVEELTSTVESAPMSGEMLFHATARVQLPAAGLASLQQALEQIAADLMVDIKITAGHH